MDYLIVIKAKCGNTLRRFNAAVGANGQLDLNMAELRAKITGLFNIASDANVTLTYIDVDGDIVTLVDDDDLHIAMSQSINPLRINVVPNSSRSTESTLPPLPDVNALPCLTTGIAEALKFVPEPLSDVLIKISHDMASKPVFSAPILCELMQALKISLEKTSKVGNSSLNPDSQVVSGADINRQDIPSEIPSLTPVDTKPEILKCGNSCQEVFPNSKHIGDVTSGGAGTSLINPSASIRPIGPFCLQQDKEIKNKYKSICSRTTRFKDPFKGFPSRRNSNARPGSHTYFYSPSSVDKVHLGIICDGCGDHPIFGPRFKSLVQENYDLCFFCYGNERSPAEYFRMDEPAPRCSRPNNSFGHHARFHPHTATVETKSNKPTFGSCFVKDVNVMDGTVMDPLTNFTKVWKMRNSGNIAWPAGIELVWVGGDRLHKSQSLSVLIETPPGGVPVDSELDIAVDFQAPEHPGGHFVSSWMMAAPSGLMFGDLVWLFIQVVDPENEPRKNVLSGLNLNFPPEGAEVVDTNGDPPLVDAEQAVHKPPPKTDQDLNFPINNTLLVGSNIPESESEPEPSAPLTQLSHAVDFPELPPPIPVPSFEPTLLRNALANSEGATERVENECDEIEVALLKQLEEMGFKQLDLNKVILRRNDFDLDQAVDDLCGVSEWDPILAELQEMGFYDTDINVKLLKKNNGSIKRVVLDLVAGGDKGSPKEKTL